MSIAEQVLTIAIAAAATMLTRFLPFLVFDGKKGTPALVTSLGKVLPAALFALLVVYSLKDVSFFSGTYGVPELIAIAAVVATYLWKRSMLVSVASGTILYMLLVQMVFV